MVHHSCPTCGGDRSAPIDSCADPYHREPREITCVHGALPKLCAFAGCSHFVPDGPRDERWAFGPGVTAEDIAAALAENAAEHARAPGSASPIHLVVDRRMRDRLEGFSPCPNCAGTGRVSRPAE